MHRGEGAIGDVLVVDDNPGDRRLIREAFNSSRLDPTIHTVDARNEALDVLAQQGEYGDVPEPDVILLDWNLSQTTGEEVLEAAKSSDSDIPVVVMTGSKSGIEGAKSSLSQADMYIEKPTDPERYAEILRSLHINQ